MELKKAILSLMFISIFLGHIPVFGKESQTKESLNEVIKKYEAQIARLYEDKDYRGAMRVACQYERNLLLRYAPPRYNMGLLQSEAEHVSSHIQFDGWKQVEAKDIGVPEEIIMAGCSILLALEGKTEEERFAVLCINADRLESRIGGPNNEHLLLSDRGLLILGNMFASNFGMAKNHQFKDVGDHRVLILDVASAFVGPDIRLVLLPKKGRLFMYMLSSSAGDIEANQDRLLNTVKTTSFDYKPENKEAITAIRNRCIRTDVRSVLNSVQSLAEIGEYGAATDELAELRRLLHANLPQATVRGETASCSAYGITLKNPDPERWSLHVQAEGVMQMVLLLDKYSVKEEGIGVAVVDLLMVYGPGLIDLFNEDETTAKEYLVNGGRGGASFIGSIEKESFAQVKGKLAYEAIVVPNMPGLRARIQFINMGDYAVMLFALLDINNFEAKLAELDRIINGDFLKFDSQAESKKVRYSLRR